MGFFKKKSDPISERARALQAKINALEGQIKKLHHGLEQTKTQPRLRSTALPHQSAPAPAAHEPVFEAVDQQRIQTPQEHPNAPGHYNELGIRKYDLVAAFRRLFRVFRSPSPSNPKLLKMLAAGNIQGLRPLRHEKRIARNRFLLLVTVFLLLLWGILVFFFRR